MMGAEKEPKTNPVAEMEVEDDVKSLIDEYKEVLKDSTMKLSKPLPDGREELVFNFDTINGYKLLKCEKQAKRLDPTIQNMIQSYVFQTLVAAAATNCKYDEIASLSGPDFVVAMAKVNIFLTSAAI